MTTIEDVLPGAMPQAAESRSATIPVPWRAIKLGIGSSLLLAGCYGVMSEQSYVSSDAAVVTAYVTSIRSPIEGEVEGLQQGAGARVRAGTVLARVVNERVDEQHVEELRQSYATGASTARSGAAERASLLREHDALLERAQAHSDAVSLRLQGQMAETARRVASREAAWQQSAAALRRGEALLADGILSRAEFEREQASERVDREDLAADRQAMKTLEGEERAARSGLLTEPGVNNDVAYSRQRADEIELRLAETERSIAQAQAQAAEVGRMLTQEKQRDRLMRGADLRAPGDRMVWRMDASNGEHVGAGDPVAELVDCNATLLLVAIPQNRVPEVLVGATARVRLSGEQAVRSGLVVSVLGDPEQGDNRKLAALPFKNTEERMATAVVALDAARGGTSCDVGRAASVQLPTVRSTPLLRWARQYF